MTIDRTFGHARAGQRHATPTVSALSVSSQNKLLNTEVASSRHAFETDIVSSISARATTRSMPRCCRQVDTGLSNADIWRRTIKPTILHRFQNAIDDEFIINGIAVSL